MTGIMSGLLGWPTSLPKDTDTQIFDTAGTYQWTKPAGAKWVKVTCIGAGCGGASGGKYGNFNSVKTYLDGTGLVMRGVNGQPAASNLASIPDNAAHRPTGDFELIVKMSSDDWTPSSARGLVWNGTSAAFNTNSLNYYLYLNTNGSLTLSRPNSAGSGRNYTSSTLGLVDGSTKWIRVVYDLDNGAGNSAATFYTSDDGVSWGFVSTALATTAAAPSVASPFRVGADGSTAGILAGKIFQVRMISDPLGTPVTVVNINFETQPANTLTFTESSSNAATVTITQAGANKGGGGGGGGGAVSIVEFAADALPGSVPVTVGRGTNGGARQTTNTAAGNNGTNGGAATTTSFGTYCGAQSTNAGTGGSNSGGAGTGVQSAGLFSSGAGLAGSITANVSVPAASNFVGGGTGGGGIDATDVIYSGGLSGGALIRPLSSGTSFLGMGGRGGTTDGVTPGDAQDGRYGGGGGGGAAGINGIVDSGAGGRGGDGVCIVTTYTGTAIDIQDFTSSGTWCKPADPRLTTATVFVLGAGGGGGSGQRNATLSVRAGGGGGGSAGVSITTVPLTTLVGEVMVTVGASGQGGTSVTANSTPGNAGAAGGTSSFGSLLFARGGTGGGAGNGASSAAAGVAGLGSYFSGAAGGVGCGSTAGGGSGGAGAFTSGGGGGGGVRSDNTGASGAGSAVQRFVTGAITAALDNANGQSPVSGAAFIGGGGGGGGGRVGADQTPRPGGAGALGGGGGGGSGSSNTGVGGASEGASGAGGNGGNGRVVIVCR